MNPRVLLMVQEFTQGGSERQCAQLALGLRARGWEVHAAAMRPGGIRAAELAAAGIPLPVFPLRSFASLDPLTAGLSLRRYLKKHQIDVFHSFDSPSNAFAIPWARLAGVAKVFSSQRAHRELTPKALRPLERISDACAHKIVVNCDSVRRELLNHYALPPSKLELIHNGIDTRQFHPAGPRAQLPVPPSSLVIGTLCALRPEKDLHTLQRAFQGIAEEFPHVHLVFVGDGPERASLEAGALQGRTHFLGMQSDTPPWYRAIDIFVLPSLSEALSNSLLEAQACGCLVVASHTGGNPELTSRLFTPGDPQALQALLRSLLQGPLPPPEPLQSNFHFDFMVDRFSSLYR